LKKEYDEGGYFMEGFLEKKQMHNILKDCEVLNDDQIKYFLENAPHTAEKKGYDFDDFIKKFKEGTRGEK